MHIQDTSQEIIDKRKTCINHLDIVEQRFLDVCRRTGRGVAWHVVIVVHLASDDSSRSTTITIQYRRDKGTGRNGGRKWIANFMRQKFIQLTFRRGNLFGIVNGRGHDNALPSFHNQGKRNEDNRREQKHHQDERCIDEGILRFKAFPGFVRGIDSERVLAKFLTQWNRGVGSCVGIIVSKKMKHNHRIKSQDKKTCMSLETAIVLFPATMAVMDHLRVWGPDSRCTYSLILANSSKYSYLASG